MAKKLSGYEHKSLHLARGENGDIYIFDDPISRLNQLIELVYKITNGDAMPFESVTRNGKTEWRQTRLGLHMKSFRKYYQFYDGSLSYSPDLNLFFECARNHKIRFVQDCWSTIECAECFNSFVDDVRREAVRVGLRRRTADWERSAEKNAKRLRFYLGKLFGRYARLNVLRIDLHYRKSICEGEKQANEVAAVLVSERVKGGMDFFEGKDPAPLINWPNFVSLSDAKADYKRLMDNARSKPSLFKNMVGHVTRFEFSKFGGYHIHLALLFDGSKSHKDSWLAEEIGKYWIATTGGRGYFYNCNRNKYAKLGVGCVDHDDDEKRDTLYSALQYLAKADQKVRIKASAGEKLFLTGKVPQGDKKIGRPRSKSLLNQGDSAGLQIPPF